jgi:hypothetical protein
MSSLEENIKKWVSIDNQIKTLTDKTKVLRETKNNMEQEILEYVESKNMKNATVNISDGKLRFVDIKQTAPLTLKYVEECLKECIKNEEQVTTIMNHIKESREIKYTPDIKRTYNNT